MILLFFFLSLLIVDTRFRDTFSTSLTSLWAQFMYYTLFYSFKHGPSPCDLLGKVRKCGLEGMGWFLSDFLHEPNTCYQVGKGLWQHLRLMEEVLYLNFPPQKSFYALDDYAPNFQPSSIFYTKTQLTLRRRLNSLAHLATQMQFFKACKDQRQQP